MSVLTLCFVLKCVFFFVFFFFNDTATTEIYTLSLHDLFRSIRWHALLPQFPSVRRFDAFNAVRDRKSTRLNSSHTVISYAVFCLKQKNHSGPVGRRGQHTRPWDPRLPRARDILGGHALGRDRRFFCNHTATTEIYTLSLHDALPISSISPNSNSPSKTTSTPPRPANPSSTGAPRSEEHTSELQSHSDLVCRLLL